MSGWERVDLSADEFAAPTEPPVICGLIYRHKRMALSAPAESVKTLVSAIVSLEWMRAGEGSVALCDFEMGEQATRLLLSDIGASLEEIQAVHYYIPGGPPDAATLDALVAAGVTLVVIDSAAGAYDASGLDDNKRADVEKFGRLWVKPLWLRGIATILLDHVVKNVDNRGKFAIGSERKLGTVDVHLGIEVIKPLHRGVTGLVKITTHKDRPGHLDRPTACEVELVSDPATHQITWTFRSAAITVDEFGTFRPTVLMGKVAAFLEMQDESVSQNEILQNVPGNTEYKRKAADKLVSEGYADVKRGPRNARMYRSLKPFHADDLAPTSPPTGMVDFASDLASAESTNGHGSTTSPDFASTSPTTSPHDFASSPPPLQGERSEARTEVTDEYAEHIRTVLREHGK